MLTEKGANVGIGDAPCCLLAAFFSCFSSPPPPISIWVGRRFSRFFALPLFGILAEVHVVLRRWVGKKREVSFLFDV